MERSTKAKIALLLLIPIVILTVAVAIYLATNDVDQRTGAVNPAGELYFSEEIVSVTEGEEFDLTLWADPDNSNGGDALGVDAVISYDSDALSATVITPGNTAGTYPYTTDSGIDNTAGEVRVSWLAYADGAVLPAQTTLIDLGVITFQAIKDGTYDITITFTQDATDDSNIARASDGDPAAATDILATVKGASITVIDNGSCTPNCSGRECGSDGCGGTCGSCDDGFSCGQGGQCEIDDPGDTTTGDLNADGEISISDYAVFLTDYIDCRTRGGTKAFECNFRSDLNEDGDIGIADYAVFLDAYINR